MKWILIVLLYRATHGVAVEHVDGFSSYEACYAAGKEVGTMMPSEGLYKYFNFRCVSSK